MIHDSDYCMLCDTATTISSQQLLQQMFSNYTPHHDATSTHSFCVLTAHFPIQLCKQNPTAFQDVRFQPFECHHNKGFHGKFVIGTSTEWREVENYADNCSGHKNMSHHGENTTSWEVNSISPSPKIPSIAWNQKVQYSSQEHITCPILS